MGSLYARPETDLRPVYLTFDNVLSEDYEMTQQLTRHPIDLTNKVADHIIQEPFRLTVVGRVTESPFDNATESITFEETPGFVEDPVALFSFIASRPRAASFFRVLEQYRTEIWTYVSESMGLRANLGIVQVRYNISRPRHVDFEVSLEEVEFARATRVELPPIQVVRQTPPQCPDVPKGDGTLTDTTNTQESKLKSIFIQGGAFDTVLNFLKPAG